MERPLTSGTWSPQPALPTQAPSAEPAIEVTGLTKVYGAPDASSGWRKWFGAKRPGPVGANAVAKKAAADDVSFTVEQGEFFVIMGLSGSGKSTVLRMLNRLVEPTAGRLVIDGRDVAAMNPDDLRGLRNRKINMVFQHFALFPHFTVRENAAYALQVRQVPVAERHERADWALETVGLGDWGDSLPGELSGGMRQRVGLARALASDADILLMDEPFSALDPLIRRDMQDLLMTLQRDLKRTVVFVTHDLNEAMRMGDRIMIMRDGRVVQLGTAQEILKTPADEYVSEFIADVDRTRVLTAGDIMQEPVAGSVGDDHQRVRDDAALSDIFSLAGRSSVPLAVTGPGGQLLGVIPQATLLAALATPVREKPGREQPLREKPVREKPVREKPVRENGKEAHA
nr:betaine/proline/choline family ABC transporter ATP-binding protein [Kineosporia mesophila]